MGIQKNFDVDAGELEPVQYFVCQSPIFAHLGSGFCRSTRRFGEGWHFFPVVQINPSPCSEGPVEDGAADAGLILF